MHALESALADAVVRPNGDQEIRLYDEDTPLRGKHPYDFSKSSADLITRTYARTYDLPVAATCCGNFFGGGGLNWNRSVPGTIRSVLRGDRPVIRSDGHFARNYFYVEDGAAAYMLLAEELYHRQELHGQAFHLSYESRITVLDVVKEILRAMQSSLEPEVFNEAFERNPPAVIERGAGAGGTGLAAPLHARRRLGSHHSLVPGIADVTVPTQMSDDR